MGVYSYRQHLKPGDKSEHNLKREREREVVPKQSLNTLVFKRTGSREKPAKDSDKGQLEE